MCCQPRRLPWPSRGSGTAHTWPMPLGLRGRCFSLEVPTHLEWRHTGELSVTVQTVDVKPPAPTATEHLMFRLILLNLTANGKMWPMMPKSGGVGNTFGRVCADGSGRQQPPRQAQLLAAHTEPCPQGLPLWKAAVHGTGRVLPGAVEGLDCERVFLANGDHVTSQTLSLLILKRG